MLDSRSEGAGRSKHVAQFEVELPPGRRLSEDVLLVEPVPDINAQRPERRHHRGPEPRAPEQAGRIVLPRVAVYVPRVEKGIDVQGPADPGPRLYGKRRERLSERVDARLPAARVGVVPVRGDRELVVPAQRNSELDAAH